MGGGCAFMMTEQIEHLEKLVLLPGKKIKSHEVKRLTAPGENYGSIMLSVDVTVESCNGSEKIPLVVKAVPPNEFTRELFNSWVTFRKEIAFYKYIVPTLQDFQRDNGVTNVIDFTPKYYGSRLNLTGGDDIDGDAVLVLENLKVENYATFNPSAGLDMEASKLILSDLAHLHAVGLAYKLRQPKGFAKNILPYLNTWKLNIHQQMKQSITQLIEQLDQVRPLKERLLEGFDKMNEIYPVREPFATIAHNDCWTNNNMFKFQGGTPVTNKLVDYQMCSYGSPARDIIFFLYCSVKNHIIKDNYDDLIRWYHEIFISVLEKLKCDTTSFSLEALEREIDIEARESQFGHVIFMLYPIFASKEHVHEVSKMTGENVYSDDVTKLHKEKFLFVVEEFLKRNWV